MIRVSGLFIYPVKGGVGMPVGAIDLDPVGPVHDRRWMVVDDEGRHVTQREIAKLCLLRATPAAQRVRLEGPGMTPLEAAPTEVRRAVTIWDDEVSAVDMGDAAAGWCSRFLAAPVRLVHIPDDSVRRTDPDYDRLGGRVGFADGYPILVIGEESLGDLNGRLAEAVPMDRFRPNIVVSGAEPFDEDRWRRFTAGGVALDGVKLCGRCQVPTTDQATGVRGKEPIKTLATYRKRGSDVMFGMNVVHRSLGTIRLGDEITVLTRSVL